MSEREIEVNGEKIEKAVKAIRASFESRKFTADEQVFIAAYLFADVLLDTEDEETHPRETFRAGIELLDNALSDLESEDEEDEPAPTATMTVPNVPALRSLKP